MLMATMNLSSDVTLSPQKQPRPLAERFTPQRRVSINNKSAEAEAESLRREIADLRSTLGKIRLNQQQQIVADELERRKLECDAMAAEMRTETLLRDTEDRNAMLEYAGLVLEEVVPGAFDSTYALKLQRRIEAATEQANGARDRLAGAEHSCEALMQGLREKVMKTSVTSKTGPSNGRGLLGGIMELPFKLTRRLSGTFEEDELEAELEEMEEPEGGSSSTSPPQSQPEYVDALRREAADLRADLQTVRTNHEEDQQSAESELAELRRSKLEADRRLAMLVLRLDDKLPSVGQYAYLIRKANKRPVDSSYVLQLQAKLARVMHKLGVLENQVTLTEQAHSLMKRQLTSIVTESSERQDETESQSQRKLVGREFALQKRLESARNLLVE